MKRRLPSHEPAAQAPRVRGAAHERVVPHDQAITAEFRVDGVIDPVKADRSRE